MYLILATAFFLTIVFGLLITLGLFTKFRSHPIYLKISKSYGFWLLIYLMFILIYTGPEGERLYQSPSQSPYKLPWKAGVSRFVSQGNRSFTSHRDLHLYAWDFWMSVGTEVMASRAGTVIKVQESYDGVGLNSNFLMIEHSDGSRAMYAHIRREGSVVEIGESVKQGQLIAYSGMVGQTINPHLHFVVFDRTEKSSVPITFNDVPGGVPKAGHYYTSANELQE